MEGVQYIGGDTFSTVGVSFSTVKVAPYIGDKNLKYHEFSKNREFFPELISLKNQIDHIVALKCQ